MGELGDFFCFVDVFFQQKKSKPAELKNKTTAGRAAVHANISSFRLVEREQLVDKPESIRDGKTNLQPEPSGNLPVRIIHAVNGFPVISNSEAAKLNVFGQIHV